MALANFKGITFGENLTEIVSEEMRDGTSRLLLEINSEA